MSLSEKKSERSGSHVSSSVSVKIDRPKEKKTSSIKSVRSGSNVSSSVSVKSDCSKQSLPPNLSEKRTSSTKSVRSGSRVTSSVSVKSDQSQNHPPNLSGERPSSFQSVRSCSHVSSSMSVKSDDSKKEPPNFSEKTSPTKRVQYEKSDTKVHEKFRKNLHSIFQDLENKMITFLKYELEKFKKILKKENTQYFLRDTEDTRIKEAALDLTLYFLREMKEDEAANTIEDKMAFIHLKSSLKKKYQCVFEGIAKQGDATLLNNIYTDLYITQGCTEQVNTEHEVRQIEVTSRRHESQEIQVECTNLFQPGKGKKIKTVLTKGVAGIGKSVSVQKFVLDWAEGKENQDISFIIPLPFREMNLKDKEKQSLMDLITQFFPETKGLNLAKRNKYKVLFILDGLDEFRVPLNFEGNETWSDVSSPASLDVLLTNLIKGNLLPSALIWITTRPAAASKIPPECIDRVTEIRGFNDAQKEEYFRKRFKDENQAKEIIDHVKKSRSLFIMCHIPVFCWISATVLKNILEMKTNNDQKNSQANDVSKTLQESNTEDTPKTLTQMYTHFLHFQILQSRRKYDGEYTPDISWDKDTILSLGKLAFHQLERNNVIFYDIDLEACGIDVYKASVYSGMCTQIFKKERGIILGTMYCFVHLSIQEFIAALYAHLFLDINKKSVFVHKSTEQENKNEAMIDLLKTAVDKALESDNGHLDLFLRFLLGLSIQSNRLLLQGLLTQQNDNGQIKKEIIQYIKQKFEANLSPERSINLFYCLNELNDQTLVKEIQTHLNKGSLSSADLSPAQWSAVAFVLLTSKEELEEFELKKFKKSDECLIRLSAVIKTCKRALLNDCDLTDRSCSALATILGSDTNLKELNINNNNLRDSGVKLLCIGLENVKCELEILRLSNCSLTEDGYKDLASALRSNPSHLIELDLTGNDPGQSGVKELNDLLQDPNCQLKKLRFLSPDAEEACQYVTGVVGINLLLLRELNLSGHELVDTRVNQIAALLQDKHCQLNTLQLRDCGLTEESCSALSTVLTSNNSLKELDISNNNLQDSGVKKLQNGLENTNCTLEKLRLSDCSITEEGYKALASALRSNPSHLIELDLKENDPGQSGVKELNDLLQDPHCQLKTLRFLSPDAEEACQYVTGIVGINPLLLRELNLSGHELVDTQVNQISALLQDKHCKVNALILSDCSITEEGYKALASALKSNPSHLIELELTGNDPGQSGVKQLSDLLQDPNCQLKTLSLCECSITERQYEGCSALTSALKSNPSHLRELDLSENKLGDSGFENLSDLLMNPQCKLEILALCKCSIKEKQCIFLTSALKSNPSHLRELDLSGNVLKHTRVNKFYDILKDSHCKLERLRLSYCAIKSEDCSALISALKSNPSHLRELTLSGNELGQLGATNLSDLLMSPQCKLEKLDLCRCSITEKQCLILTSALKSNPSHLRELDLSKNKLGNSGVENLGVLLGSSQCKLEKLHLNDCGITDVACLAQSLAETKALQFLKELDLSNNKIGDSKQQLSDVLRNRSLEKEHLLRWKAGVNYIGSFSGWLTSWSKAQEEPVELTEQEKSLSDDEFSI
ncbi:NACHT, LRR and PYD domains-containing protein 3 [Labeo rohita]|uniref:NACHT, LRR and PYD domains-containing protein 3 n=1 Tax=Labeo rohita TaxID=84645 RepID=UPI0021E27C20|nr:NACHT, LRR and PYD domains-containing protein 3 [Labeo rohita]